MHIQFYFQIFMVLNITIVGVRIETWTSEDRYGNFSPVPLETLRLFETYAITHIQNSYDAAILLT